MYSYEETMELLQRAVTEKGDGYVYDKTTGLGPGGCSYRNRQGAPACIVGHVLDYVGLLDEIDIYGSNNHLAIGACEYQNGMATKRMVPRAIVEAFSDASFDAMTAAQRAQDEGMTWGEALIAAKEVTP